MRFLICFITLFWLTACHDHDKSVSDVAEEPVEEQEWLPVAGNATISYESNHSFLQFVPNLDLTELSQASKGRELFTAHWLPAPNLSQPLLDGFGPLGLVDACAGCHQTSARAESLKENGEIGPGLLFRLLDQQGNADPTLGGQLQTVATEGNAEGSVHWREGLQGRVDFLFEQQTHALSDGIQLAPRLSPQLFGMGLLDAIPDQTILAFEDENDLNGDGISGRAHWHSTGQTSCLGKYGWKAMQCSLQDQIAGALQQDMGLTSSLAPNEPCTEYQPQCAQAASGGDPEVSDVSLNAMEHFLAALAVPARRAEDLPRFNRGARLFRESGCNACHRETLKTGDDAIFSVLKQQTLYAYTDLLLHDMGADLSDGAMEGNASVTEWRTPPLWGLGLMDGDGQSRFLHDGRAATLEEAIFWHGGEALFARRSYEALTSDQQADFLYFLKGI